MKTKDMILMGFVFITLFSSFITYTMDTYFAILMVAYLIFIFVAPHYLNKKTRGSLIIITTICVLIIMSIMINKYWMIISKSL
jgi:hypothetical protein